MFPIHPHRLLLFLLFLASLGLTATPSAQAGLGVEEAVQQALTANPGLAAIHARAEALAALPSQQESLPDPKLTLRMANLPLDTFSFTQEGMTQMQVGISQALPFPGTLSLRKEAALHESLAAQDEVAEARLRLVKDVKTIWWNIFFIDRALETVQRNHALLQQFVTIAQTKYRVGKGIQQDVLLAQLELSKLMDTTISLKQQRHNQVVKLNTLLNRPPETAIVLADHEAEQTTSLPPAERLQELALTNRPLLQASQKRVTAAEARVGLAHKLYYPDFTVGAVYGYRDGTNPDGSSRADFGSVAVSMNLPIFQSSRNDASLSQRVNEKSQRTSALLNSRNMVEKEVSTALNDFEQAAEQARLFKNGIIPQARLTVDSMMAGYQVGKVDFLNLVRSQTSLYNYETKYWRAYSASQQALARLTAAIGVDDIAKEMNHE